MAVPDEDTTDMTTVVVSPEDLASTNLTDVTTATPQEVITACEKALAIPHVLKAIICGLSPGDITIAKRVCHAWQDTILASKKIRLARTLTPHSSTDVYRRRPSMDLCGPLEPPDYDPDLWLPEYVAAKLTINPIFHDFPVSCYEGINKFALTKSYDYIQVLVDVESHHEEFMTSPRCSAITMSVVKLESMTLHNGPRVESCVVYDPMGVKVKDMMAIVDKMVEQASFGGIASLLISGELEFTYEGNE